MDKQTRDEAQGSFMEADPEDWPVWTRPMTEAQRWHLRFLSAASGIVVDESLTQAEAAKRINELRARARRDKERH